MDFTISSYNNLLNSLIENGYTFQTFDEFLKQSAKRAIILRHDVDAKKLNSLHFAKIQNRLGIKGSYYFRMVPQSYDAKVISEIAALGHEIGYHYEDMDFAFRKMKSIKKNITEKDLYEEAIKIFEENLKTLRKLYPISTICMHGSPLSKFDNKSLWGKYKYHDFDIIGEPYFDVDFSKVFYITDTGRRWDGDKVSIRDKVNENGSDKYVGLRFHSTKQLINAANEGILPDQIMMTFHPQRWNDNKVLWLQELVMQNLKNVVKRFLIQKRKKNEY
jgi:hypothetical protein